MCQYSLTTPLIHLRQSLAVLSRQGVPQTKYSRRIAAQTTTQPGIRLAVVLEEVRAQPFSQAQTVKMGSKDLQDCEAYRERQELQERRVIKDRKGFLASTVRMERTDLASLVYLESMALQALLVHRDRKAVKVQGECLGLMAKMERMGLASQEPQAQMEQRARQALQVRKVQQDRLYSSRRRMGMMESTVPQERAA